MIFGCQASHDISSAEYPTPALTFNEAFHLARNGMSYIAVVDAMRFELRKIEKSASRSALIELKINLAAALMDCANQSPIYDVFDPLYEEGQSLLESVLQIQPNNRGAEQNLSVLRKNRAEREKMEQIKKHRVEKNSASDPINSAINDEQVQPPMLFLPKTKSLLSHSLVSVSHGDSIPL